MNMIKETRKEMESVKKVDLDKCFRPDNVTYNLWGWAEHLERLGKIIVVGTIVVGVIVAAYTTYQISSDSFYMQSYYSYYPSFDSASYNAAKVTNFIVTLLGFILGGVAEYIVCHSIALILGAYAGISQNTRATALMTKLYIENTCEFADDGATGLSGMAAAKSRVKRTAENGWTCPKCDGKNEASNIMCKYCGTYK